MISSYINRLIEKTARNTINSIEHDINAALKQLSRRISRYLAAELITLAIIIGSIGCFFLAIIFFLIEYVHLNRFISFFIVGTVLLLLGLLLKVKK